MPTMSGHRKMFLTMLGIEREQGDIMEQLTEAFQIRFAGDGVNDNSMDVRLLAPSLLALADAMKGAGRVIYPKEAAPKIEIRATEPGSFVLAMVSTSTLTQQVLGFLTSQPIEGVLNVAGLATIVVGAVKLLIHIGRHGGKAREEHGENGTVTLRWEDGSTLVVPEESVQVAKDLETRRGLRAFVEPLGSEEISTVEMTTDGSEVEVVKADIPAFELPEVADREETTSIRRVVLRISQATLEGSYVWRVNDGGPAFAVTMSDEDFKAAVERGTERFGVGDQLIVDLQESQYTRADGSLRTERAIVKVHDHTEPPRQAELPLFAVDEE